MSCPNPMATNDNRRRLERFAMNIPSHISPLMHEDSDQLLTTTNISSGGVFFATENTYPIGTAVTLNIALDFGSGKPSLSQSRFRVEGTVVRTDPSGMAIAFDPTKVTSIKLGPGPKPERARPAMVSIVGPDTLLNDLLAAKLSQETGVSCSHSKSLTKILNTAKPDLTLVDCASETMPDFLHSMSSESSLYMATPIALFNVPEDRSLEQDAISCGVRGVFFRNSTFKLLVKGIATMLDNELWYSREAMSTFLLENSKLGARTEELDLDELSSREKEILTMLASGATNRDIAAKLYVSLNTVKSHIYNIYKKIDVPNRLQASMWAAKNLKEKP